jgi:hypothetical protein
MRVDLSRCAGEVTGGGLEPTAAFNACNAPVLLSLGGINAAFQIRVAGARSAGSTLMARDFRRLSGGEAAPSTGLR